MRSKSVLFNQGMPSREGQWLKMKGRWFSCKVLSRASSPRKSSVITSLEETEGASAPYELLVFKTKEVTKFQRAKMPGRSLRILWSGRRKACTELTGIRKIRFGPLPWQQWFFRFSHSAHQQEASCWENRILHKVKQDHGSSQNDKAKEILGFRPPTWKATELNPIYKVLVDLFFVNIPFWRKGIRAPQRSVDLIERDLYYPWKPNWEEHLKKQTYNLQVHVEGCNLFLSLQAT